MAPTQTYRKSHLVPFGEFVPLKPVFGWFFEVAQIPLLDFARGADTQQPLDVAGQRVAVDICYEDAFGAEIIRQLPQATLLVNVSNVAWFGRSVAPQQHLQISQARALETGRYVLRATNTGMTAIIDQAGQGAAGGARVHARDRHRRRAGLCGRNAFRALGQSAHHRARARAGARRRVASAAWNQ